ncbi:hypothetical protein [Photorhabdus temperata]|uniref:hypothetical protein n=1 Tax=Photorhabdus temperata TaxID=574560 RepID=UPI00190F9FA0|nr:hypothetical protein [Photorhabdus temperata]
MRPFSYLPPRIAYAYFLIFAVGIPVKSIITRYWERSLHCAWFTQAHGGLLLFDGGVFDEQR